MSDPVAEARALLAAATPGPWRVGDPDSLNPRVDAPEWAICHVYDADERPYDLDDDSIPLDPTPLADAALIAAAPELLARLCDEIERLRALAATWTEEADFRCSRASNPEVVGLIEREIEVAAALAFERCANEVTRG